MICTDLERQATRRYRFNAVVNVLDSTFYRFGASFVAFAFSLIGSALLYRTVQELRQRANAPAPADTGIST
jgi:hypothetical protein